MNFDKLIFLYKSPISIIMLFYFITYTINNYFTSQLVFSGEDYNDTESNTNFISLVYKKKFISEKDYGNFAKKIKSLDLGINKKNLDYEPTTFGALDLLIGICLIVKYSYDKVGLVYSFIYLVIYFLLLAILNRFVLKHIPCCTHYPHIKDIKQTYSDYFENNNWLDDISWKQVCKEYVEELNAYSNNSYNDKIKLECYNRVLNSFFDVIGGIMIFGGPILLI